MKSAQQAIKDLEKKNIPNNIREILKKVGGMNVIGMAEETLKQLRESAATRNFENIKTTVNFFKGMPGGYESLKNELINMMINAASDGDLELLKLLIEELQLSPNLRFPKKRMNEQTGDMVTVYSLSALMMAASHAHDKTVLYLLSKNADPNLITEYNDTALHYATNTNPSEITDYTEAEMPEYKKRYTLIVKYLLAKGADPFVQNNNGFTPLMCAMNEGVMANIETAKLLLNAVKKSENAEDGSSQGNGQRSIQKYDQQKRQKSFNRSLKRYFNLEDKFGLTAALRAVIHNVHFIEEFLKYPEFSLEDRTSKNLDLLSFAITGRGRKADPKKVEYLLKIKAIPRTEHIMDAIGIDEISAMKYLYDTGRFSINQTLDERNTTALSHAASFGRKNIVKYLIETKADIDSIDRFGDTPLLKAIHSEVAITAVVGKVENVSPIPTDHLGCVDLLLKAKANVNHTSLINNFTPLLYAAWHGETDILNRLLKEKPDLNRRIKSLQGGTPTALSICARAYPDCLKALLKYSHDFQLPLEDKEEALVHAAFGGQKKNLMLLLEDQFYDNKDLVRAFRVAIEMGHVEIIDFFIKSCGLDINVVDAYGYSAIESTGDPNIVKILRQFGVTDSPIHCQHRFCTGMIFLKDIDIVKKYIEVVDVNRNFQFLTGWEKIDTPLFLLSNASSQEIRSLILKYKLWQDYPKIQKTKIENFVDKLMENCLDFLFSEEGYLIIKIKHEKSSFEISLGSKGIQFILERQGNITADNLITLILKNAEESEEVKKAKELRALQNEFYTVISKSYNVIVRCLEVLLVYEKKYASSNVLNQQEIASFKEKCQSMQYNLEELLILGQQKEFQKSEDFTFVNSYVIKARELYQNCETEIIVDWKKIQEDIQKKLEGQNNKMSDRKAKHKRKHKGKKDELPTTTKIGSNLNQSGIVGAGISAKGVTAKEILAKGISERDVSEKGILEKGVSEKEIPKTEVSDPNDLRNKEIIELNIATQKLDHERENLKLLPLPIKTHKKIYNPDLNLLPETPIYLLESSFSDADYKTYTRIPNYTFETASHLSAITGALAANNRLDRIAQDHNLLNGVVETPIDKFLFYNSSLGALAQALEARKEFQENWPNGVRNSIFRNEEALQVYFEKQENYIGLIQKINDNIKKFSQKELNPKWDLKHKREKLALDSIDEQGFLSKICEAGQQIPPYSLPLAEKMIDKSIQELKLFQEYLTKNAATFRVDGILKQAIGFSLARIGTHLNDIRNHDGDISKWQKKYGRFIPFGCEYRHNNTGWILEVEAYIERCLAKDKTSNMQLLWNQSKTLMSREKFLNRNTLVTDTENKLDNNMPKILFEIAKGQRLG